MRNQQCNMDRQQYKTRTKSKWHSTCDKCKEIIIMTSFYFWCRLSKSDQRSFSFDAYLLLLQITAIQYRDPSIFSIITT